MKTTKSKMPTLRRKYPLLNNGDRMTQPEFHAIYEQCPEDFKAELIGGVVYVASPVRRPHGTFHVKLSGVLMHYEAMTPGVEAGDNLSTILDGKREPQPDLLLRVETEAGGQTHYDADDYLIGGPELVAEIAHSSKAIDMGQKREDYFHSGVQEYLVVCVEERELHWFHFPSRRLLKPDANGIYRSKVFPGLWLDGPALLAQDAAKLLKTIMVGVESPQHVAFVKKLARRRK